MIFEIDKNKDIIDVAFRCKIASIKGIAKWEDS